jgi:hypothetical protein
MAVSLLLPFSEPGELDDRGESALGIACRLGRTEAERAIRQYLSVFDERAAIGAAADCCESLGDSKRL